MCALGPLCESFVSELFKQWHQLIPKGLKARRMTRVPRPGGVDPGLRRVQHHLPPQPEVRLDDALQLGRRVLQQVDHRVADRALRDVLVVLAALLLALVAAVALLEAGLVEEGVGHEDEGLDGEEDLERRGGCGVPALALAALPRAQ